MNRNKPEKLARIELRVKPKDKERIVKTANQCGLSTSEYVLQRALGYTPKTVNPDAFYHFYGKLCELLNQELTPELQAAALKLFDEIYAELIDNSKQPISDLRLYAFVVFIRYKQLVFICVFYYSIFIFCVLLIRSAYFQV